MSDPFDLIVIGSGPGGYVCAIRAAQLGMKVAVIDKRGAHGGTCLNVGCIPSKAMLHTSHLYHDASHSFENFGIEVSKPKLNLKKMMGHKQNVIDANVGGISFLFKKNKITDYFGAAEIIAQDKVKITDADGKVTEIAGKNIVIATGSDSVSLPGIEIDEKQIVSSTGALELEKVPEHMVVIGGGVIGLELGSVWSRLGAKVTVVEYLDRILPGMDLEVAKTFARTLKKQGMDIKTGKKVTGVEKAGNGLKVGLEPAKGGDASTIDADIVLVAVGRRPYTDNLGLETIGVKRDDRGRVEIDAQYRTNVSNIFAIGDVTVGPMLAHKAEDEGIAVAEILAGQAGHVNYDVIPGVVYTMPEVASVGKTEEELKEAGIEYTVGKFPFTANGRAKAMDMTDGMVKILADKKTDRVLGCHIIGATAGDLIHEAAVLMEFSGSAEDLARTCHAHPTLAEAVREAALAIGDGPIHM